MTSPDAGITAVVVAYGPVGALEGALEALEGAVEAVVVDNGSLPATAEVARRAGARYVDPGANVGFAAAVNRGLAEVTAGHDVLLLNPDARIAPAELAKLHDILTARPDLACVAPAQRGAGGGPMRARWPWHTPLGAWAEALGLARLRLRSRRYFVGGAVLVLRAGALADVGNLDERFFLYGEDEDWERRAVRRGWRVRYCPEVQAEHGGGGTDTERERQQLRLHAAVERYVRKWYGAGGWTVFRVGTLVGFGLRAAVRGGSRRRGAARLAHLYLRGPDTWARRQGAVPR